MPARKKKTVFISSTSNDLVAYRAVARLAVLDVQWIPEMMEHFGTSPITTVKACLEKVEGCDVMLLIVAYQKGWVPEPEQDGDGTESITSMELRHARAKGIPVLILLAGDDWPGKLWEAKEADRKWMEAFRNNLNQPADFFESEKGTDADRLPVFRSKVVKALTEQKLRMAEAEPASRDEVNPDFYEKAVKRMVGANSIPFLGSGIFGNGPLSSQALAIALDKELNKSEKGPHSLTTAAELREQTEKDRLPFLNLFREVLQNQTQSAQPTAVHELLARKGRFPLIVSTSFDMMLEDILLAQGKPIAIISHILRSAKKELDGNVLVIRKGVAGSDLPVVSICEADKLEVGNDEQLIYKPLGSPLLHDSLKPEMEVDTVVLTERDHLTFLRRLENQSMKVPAVVTRLLRSNTPLFMGYTLDFWHYRLVMEVFKSDYPGTLKSAMAVRRADSPLENISWRRLDVDMVHMDPGEFATDCLALIKA